MVWVYLLLFFFFLGLSWLGAPPPSPAWQATAPIAHHFSTCRAHDRTVMACLPIIPPQSNFLPPTLGGRPVPKRPHRPGGRTINSKLVAHRESFPDRPPDRLINRHCTGKRRWGTKGVPCSEGSITKLAKLLVDKETGRERKTWWPNYVRPPWESVPARPSLSRIGGMGEGPPQNHTVDPISSHRVETCPLEELFTYQPVQALSVVVWM